MSKLRAICLIAVAALAGTTAVVRADTRIQGAGATFPLPLYQKWVETFNAAHPDVKVDYQGIGSGGGIKGITDRTLTFAGSDAPMTADQEKNAPAALYHLPTVGGPVVMIYNLPDVTTRLKMNGEVISGIYLDQIKKWNDPKIAKLNPGVALPDKPIVVAHRSDGSGTTFIFTSYLSKVSGDWKEKVGNATSIEWPAGLGGKGNAGVADIVKKTDGGVGYVEFAYATQNKLPYALLINAAGKEVDASIEGVVSASENTLKNGFPPDMKVNITNAPGDASYPICGYTYMLVYQDLSYLKDKSLADQLLNFIRWCETDGQKMAKDLGYAQLPAEAQAKVLERLKTIQFNGQMVLN